MAFREITSTPVDLISAMSLTAGTTYSIQVDIPGSVSGSGGTYAKTGPYVHLDDGTSAPVVADQSRDGRKVRHLETILMSGDNIWCWTTRGKAIINVYEGV